MILPITLTVAGAAAILHIWLSLRVSRLRRPLKIGVGERLTAVFQRSSDLRRKRGVVVADTSPQNSDQVMVAPARRREAACSDDCASLHRGPFFVKHGNPAPVRDWRPHGCDPILSRARTHSPESMS